MYDGCCVIHLNHLFSFMFSAFRFRTQNIKQK